MPATAVYSFAMPVAEAYDYTRGALEASGATLGPQTPPERIDFAIHRKDPDTGAIDLDMPGHADFAAEGEGKSSVTLSLDPATNLFVYGLGIGVMAIIFGSWIGGGGPLWFLIVLAIEAWLFWSIFNKWPTAALDAIRAKMTLSPSVNGGAPVVQPVAPIFAPMPPRGPAAANAAEIADQIRDLAALRDQGHISQDEFDAKKSELLKRI